ncbi:hypothetical protein IV102_30090 [bacterium]|nr:hypothetical protein [bacterium]
MEIISTLSPDGRHSAWHEILKDIDRNGNVNTYDRSSGNLVISDGKGRALYYDYGLTPRVDGQTQTLRVNDPVAGRLITFSYYSDSDPVTTFLRAWLHPAPSVALQGRNRRYRPYTPPA